MSSDDDDDDGNGGPTDSELKTAIRRLIPKVNLQNTGVKAFTKLLQKEFGGIDLKHRNAFIRDALTEAINAMESTEEEEDSDDDSDDEGAASKSKKKTTKKATTTAASKKRKAPTASVASKKKKAAATSSKKKKDSSESSSSQQQGRGLSLKKEISKDLANFLGMGNEMARTEIVKALWDYIRKHNLQNPENKREILLDKKMKAVFGVDTFTMFTMNKYIAAHIHPFKPVDLTTNSNKKKKKSNDSDDDDDSDDGGAPKRKRRKKADSSSKRKRKPKKPGLQPPYRLSKPLQELVGKEILPRPQVVTALWEYIKKNDLQNPEDKREIICDKKLKTVMGGQKKVTMFNMNRFITEHLVEKLDRSAYTHDEDEDLVVAEEVEDSDDDDGGNDDDESEEEDTKKKRRKETRF